MIRAGAWRCAGGVAARRFVGIYAVACVLPFPLSLLAGEAQASAWWNEAWWPIVRAVGRHVLRIDREITVLPAGSGDTTFNYVQSFCMIVGSAAVAVAWTLIDRRETTTSRLELATRFIVRHALAFAMLSYGLAKVLVQQFPPVGADRLIQTYGESSPMGLLWTFMGASPAYQVFAGAMECLAGVLLLSRRTCLIGAIVAAGVMVNVVALNFCYDLPVKLYSTHLLMLALLLIAPRATVVAAALLERPDMVREGQCKFRSPHRHRFRRAVSMVLVAAMAWNLWLDATADGPDELVCPAEGLYLAEGMDPGRDAAPPAAADWVLVGFGASGRVGVRTADGRVCRWWCRTDRSGGRLVLFRPDEPEIEHVLMFRMVRTPHEVVLDVAGEINDTVVRVRLTPAGDERSLLKTRGFHWITERSFNR